MILIGIGLIAAAFVADAKEKSFSG